MLPQFADDIALWAYGSNTIMSQCKIQKHLDNIIKWWNVWRIKLHPLIIKLNPLYPKFYTLVKQDWKSELVIR